MVPNTEGRDATHTIDANDADLLYEWIVNKSAREY